MEKSVLDERWLGTLGESGYRITAPRRLIVEIIASSPRALNPIEIYDLGRKEYPRLGLTTVYRTLEKLEELGLLQRVHHPNGCNLYLRAAQGHEHFLLCTSCGQVEYFSGDDLTGLMQAITQRSGFKIQGHWLQLYGLCAACQVPLDSNS